MPPKVKVQIFYSEEEKKKASSTANGRSNAPRGAVDKPKGKVVKSAGRAIQKVGKPVGRPKAKVVKSATRPIIKVGRTSKIVQPRKGSPMQPKNTEKVVKPRNQQAKTGAPKDAPARGRRDQGKFEGMRSAPSSSAQSDFQMDIQQLSSKHSISNQSTKYAVALHTAQVIADNPSHPRQKDVAELLGALQKGWIDQRKFNEVLQGMLF